MKVAGPITLLLLWGFVASAQTPQSQSPAANIRLPRANGAWTVRILTAGGFTGTGEGDWAISSAGRIICTLAQRCPKSFTASAFQSLVETLAAINLPIPSPPVTTLCRDCISRTLIVEHRDAMGRMHTFATSWDDTTTDSVPPEVLRIYRAVLALRQP